MKKLTPVKILILGYFSIILLGALLLLLPFSRRGPLGLTDAVFTSTSAVCVTGLIVKDTPVFFTFFGKLVILILIQIGGIGYMTFATVFIFALGRRGSLRLRLIAAESFPALTPGNIWRFAINVLKITFVLELFGAFLLFIGFVLHGIKPALAILHSIFISVSAFCNAGFATFSDSLVSFKANIIVNFTVMVLIFIGGIGFFVIMELYEKFVTKEKKKLSLHTKAALSISAILILVSSLFFFIYESIYGYGNYSFVERIFASLFQAVTPRTAGFNTIDLNFYHPASIFLLIILMIIGGSPGGTAGGIKTTTFYAYLAWIRAYFQRKEPVFHGYRIPDESLKRSVTILIITTIVILLAILLLSISEVAGIQKNGILPYLFEIASAFGTVGLSLGSKIYHNVSLSADFSIFGKWIIISLMLIGKVGVLSIVALISEIKPEPVRHVEGKYIVG